MARLGLTIYRYGSRSTLILTSTPSRSEVEAVLHRHRDADAVILWGPGAWRLSQVFLQTARSTGFNPFALDFVDQVEEELSGLALEALIDIRLSRLVKGLAASAHFKVDRSKRVSRRSLLRNPLASLLTYTGAPIVDAGACKSLPSCSLCLEACPSGALKGKPPSVDMEACSECMECVYACPAWAIHPPGSARGGLVGLLDGLRNAGFSGVLVLTEAGRLADFYGLRRSQLRGRLAFLPVPALSWVHPRIALEAARRGVPLIVYDPSGEAPGWIEEACKGGLAVKVNSLESIVRAASSPVKGVGAVESVYPFAGSVRVNEDECLVCGACSNACPVGALDLAMDLDAYELRFNPGACIGCTECSNACPHGALSISWITGLPSSSWVSLASSKAHSCPSCGSIVGPKKQLDAVAKQLRSAGMPEAVVERIYLCPACKLAASPGGGGGQHQPL